MASASAVLGLLLRKPALALVCLACAHDACISDGCKNRVRQAACAALRMLGGWPCTALYV
jgi:hypothetical protein